MSTDEAVDVTRVTTEHIRWAYRLYLDREPEDDGVLERPWPNTHVLREALLLSDEFRQRNPDFTFSFPGWVIKETTHGFRLYVSLREMAICRPVLMDLYDTNEAAFVKGHVEPNTTVLDIGANIGFYAMLMGRLVGPNGTVIAFEPIAYLADALERSRAENRFGEIVRLHRAALSDTDGEAMIRHAPMTTNFGGGHLTSGSALPDGHVDERVRTLRLDGIATPSRVTFIKIDVEGAEPRVVAGGKELLRRDRPVILSELHNGQLAAVSGSNATAFVASMRDLGYRCSALLGGRRSDPVTEYAGDAPINVVFDPDEAS